MNALQHLQQASAETALAMEFPLPPRDKTELEKALRLIHGVIGKLPKPEGQSAPGYHFHFYGGGHD